MPPMTYPKRLIEVDLPIRRISAHARREKSIRHGHISTLHIWWARRPLAACRAVLCASLWPDPADELCPQAFRDEAAALVLDFAQRVRNDPKLPATCDPETAARWIALADKAGPLDPTDPAHLNCLRHLLLDFIADFANWDNSTQPDYLEISRTLTQSAHEALGGEPGTRPLVVDPFAGGGSIPLEALRIGADAFASDLNSVAVLLNKVVLEYIPKYGQQLADEVRKWGQSVKKRAEEELGEFYPRDPDGAVPIAYLWARTITCEGPGCGAEVPLIRSLWLAKKAKRSVALRIVPNPTGKRVDFEIIPAARASDVGEGTVRRGSASCPCCGYTTPVKSVREQLKKRRGGAADARLFCVVTTHPGEQGRHYRLPTEADLEAVRRASEELERRKAAHTDELSLVPDEELDVRGIRHTWAMIYGMSTWGDLFTPRQLLALTTLARLVREVSWTAVPAVQEDPQDRRDACSTDLHEAVQVLLALAVSRNSDINNAECRWEATKTQVRNLFTRQAIPMVWDFAEPFVFADAAGSFLVTLETMVEVLAREARCPSCARMKGAAGASTRASATSHPLPDDAANAFVTDPPYYDAVPYAYLSDFFYVWLRRLLSESHAALFADAAVPKDAEIVVDRPHELSNSHKDVGFYERGLTQAFGEGRRVLGHDGVGVIVFASKTTASWEAVLQAVLDGGWVLTASWPIDTEMANRVAATDQARLASSIHLVCRPRENPDGSLREEIGDWRQVLSELPARIHSWMPRLRDEGVVGADAIFACLGPALEIFSRYSSVEKASGEVVTLGEYLEHVWAAVSREALSMIFEGADATGFEEDARLTAIWLWTVAGAVEPSPPGPLAPGRGGEGDEDDTDDAKPKPTAGGYSLEYDAARKIAQGLGAHLEELRHVVEVKGDTARLLSIPERTRYLFGSEAKATAAKAKRKPKREQLDLFGTLQELEEEEARLEVEGAPEAGRTALDRVHQSMVLFATNRGEALRRFLVEDGAGRDERFWRLAQALSALYPMGTDEKRWVDGVLARKKGLGL